MRKLVKIISILSAFLVFGINGASLDSAEVEIISQNSSETLNMEIFKTQNGKLQANFTKIPYLEKLSSYEEAPRCGFHDEHYDSNQLFFHLFSLPKWSKRHITWNFNHKNGKFISEALKIRQVLTNCLKLWSEVSVLTFEEVHNKNDADIVASFERTFHPEIDLNYMGGPTLAHAFPPGPGIGGDVHFREDFNWNFDVTNEERPPRGQHNFFGVALHELGHSIGLNHINNNKALMYPFYTSPAYISKHDIKAIQSLYGVPKGFDGRTTTETPVRRVFPKQPEIPLISKFDIPSKCDMTYDAIARISGELFIFKGRFMFRPDHKSEEIEIRSTWKELPEDFEKIDAVYQYDGGEIGFFIGRDIYLFRVNKFFRKLSLEDHGIFSRYKKIDAFFNWPHGSWSYIFSGEFYWRMSHTKVDAGYPKRISDVWKGVEDFDTAFNDNGKIFFIKGRNFFEFNTKTLTLDQANPRSSAQYLMKCPFKIESDVEIFDASEFEFTTAERRISLANSQSHHMLPSIILTSLTVSQVLSSISRYF